MVVVVVVVVVVAATITAAAAVVVAIAMTVVWRTVSLCIGNNSIKCAVF